MFAGGIEKGEVSDPAWVRAGGVEGEPVLGAFVGLEGGLGVCKEDDAGGERGFRKRDSELFDIDRAEGGVRATEGLGCDDSGGEGGEGEEDGGADADEGRGIEGGAGGSCEWRAGEPGGEAEGGEELLTQLGSGEDEMAGAGEEEGDGAPVGDEPEAACGDVAGEASEEHGGDDGAEEEDGGEAFGRGGGAAEGEEGGGEEEDGGDDEFLVNPEKHEAGGDDER